MEDAKLLSTKEVAVILDKHVKTISRWRRNGTLPVPLIDARKPQWSYYQIRIWSTTRQLGTIGNIETVTG